MAGTGISGCSFPSVSDSQTFSPEETVTVLLCLRVHRSGEVKVCPSPISRPFRSFPQQSTVSNLRLQGLICGSNLGMTRRRETGRSWNSFARGSESSLWLSYHLFSRYDTIPRPGTVKTHCLTGFFSTLTPSRAPLRPVLERRLPPPLRRPTQSHVPDLRFSTEPPILLTKGRTFSTWTRVFPSRCHLDKVGPERDVSVT